MYAKVPSTHYCYLNCYALSFTSALTLSEGLRFFLHYREPTYGRFPFAWIICCNIYSCAGLAEINILIFQASYTLHFQRYFNEQKFLSYLFSSSILKISFHCLLASCISFGRVAVHLIVVPFLFSLVTSAFKRFFSLFLSYFQF